MSIEFGWTVATAVTGWLQQAIKAAKNQRQQRFAHIIGNGGVMVAGLRSIDREMHRLFLPLKYFDPQGWPEEKRREWAERIVALAHEDVILPRMRAADSALATLATQERDPEIAGLIERLRAVDPEVRPAPLADRPQFLMSWEPPGYADGSKGFDSLLMAARLMEEAKITSQIYGVDLILVDYIPKVISALLGEDSPRRAKLEEVASDASRILTTSAAGLRLMADATEHNFGLLLGYQQRVFPGLPAPTWIWADSSG